MIVIRSASDVLTLLALYRKLFFLSAATLLAVALVGLFASSPSYVSTADLLVMPGRESMARPPDGTGRVTVPVASTPREVILDEQGLIESEIVRRQVAEIVLALPQEQDGNGIKDRLKKFVGTVTRNVAESARTVLIGIGLSDRRSDNDRLSDDLSEAMVIDHTPTGGILRLSLTWTDPLAAQRILEEWVAAYARERVRAYGRPSLTEFFETLALEEEARLEATSSELAALRIKLGGMTTAQRAALIAERLEALKAEQLSAEIERTSLDATLARLRSQLDALPSESVREQVFGPYATLTTETRGPNLVRERLDEQFVARQNRMVEVDAEVARRDQEIEVLSALQSEILGLGPRMQVLEANLAIHDENYRVYRQSLERARIAEGMDRSLITSVSIMDPPTFNPSRVSPKPVRTLVVALLLAGVAGLFVVYLVSLLDRRLFDGQSVVRFLRNPFLGLVPGAQPAGLRQDDMKHAADRTLRAILKRAQGKGAGGSIALVAPADAPDTEALAELFTGLVATRLNGSNVEIVSAGSIAESPVAYPVLERAGGIVLVVESRLTTAEAAADAEVILQRDFGDKMLGVIVSGYRDPRPARVRRHA